MRQFRSLLVSIVITISILSSLIAASGAIVLFENLIIANAQPSQPSASEQLATQKEVDTIILQGTATSLQDPLPGHEGMQMATILPFRQDGTVYSGVLTYTSTAPVEVVTLNMQTLNETEQDILNATDDGEFGALFTSQLDDQTSLSSSYIIPSYAGSPIPSASVPFVGNAVWLHTMDGTPFSATFAVNALVLPSQIQNKFNDPMETADTEALEDDEEGADGEATEDVDNENTTDTDTDEASEQGDDLDAEEETEEDTAATTAMSDEEDDGDDVESAAADDTTENADEADNEESIVIIPEGSSSLTDDAYRPNPIEVNTGDTVTWINDDLTSHTATSGNPESGSTGMFGGTDDSPEIIGPEGDTQSFTFDEAGEFEYYCTLHPSMVGTVIVTEG
jgi:plastocyanin